MAPGEDRLSAGHAAHGATFSPAKREFPQTFSSKLRAARTWEIYPAQFADVGARLELRESGLVRQLLEARDTRGLTRLQQRLLPVDVLIVD